MNIKALAIIALLIIVSAFTYMYQSDKSKKEKLKLAEEQAQTNESTSQLVALGIDKQVAIKVVEAQSAAGKIKNLNINQVKEFETLILEWRDAEKVASLTGRGALAQPVSHLQDIKRKLDGVIYIGCLESTRLIYVSAMNSGVESYYEFMRGDDNNVATNLKTQNYQTQLKRAEKEYEICKSFMDK